MTKFLTSSLVLHCSKNPIAKSILETKGMSLKRYEVKNLLTIFSASCIHIQNSLKKTKIKYI